MKKNREVDCFFKETVKKLLMSGNSLLLLLLLTFNIQAAVLSQTVSLKLKDVTLRECFREIEKQTGLGFLFNTKDINDIDHISIDLENKNVEAVLKEILEGTNLSYKIENNVILIVRTPEKGENPLQQPQVKKKIMGRVTDEKGEPLPGVNVIFKQIGRASCRERVYHPV